jgi:DNA recombination protein RmuC
MNPVAIVALVLVAVVLAVWWVRRSLLAALSSRVSDERLALLQSQINTMAQQTAQQVEALRGSVQGLGTQVYGALSETNRTVGERLDNAARVISDVRQQLGQLEESSRRIMDLGRDMTSLQQILQPPKMRGSLGELFLSDLLAQILPADHYRLQHRFKSGEAVDAVVILRGGMVPIDAKFPLENFRRSLSAESDDDKKAARRAFVKDVKGHIDDISAKYIRMDEGTFDFALMYIPAENVYYETIIKDDESAGDASLFGYALKRRVIPVSPNSFYAYLQTVILGLKGMRIEEGAREILEGLSRLHKEFEAFSEAFRLVGQHLENCSKKYEDAVRRFGKVESRIEQMDGMVKGLEETAPQPQLPAAP